jgi:hypothetical protein
MVGLHIKNIILTFAGNLPFGDKMSQFDVMYNQSATSMSKLLTFHDVSCNDGETMGVDGYYEVINMHIPVLTFSIYVI